MNTQDKPANLVSMRVKCPITKKTFVVPYKEYCSPNFIKAIGIVADIVILQLE
jgi:hypothetical protein